MNALKYLILLAAIIFILPVSAQVKRSIKGTVKDSTERKPLPGANIRILSEKDTLSATADDDGAFQINGIKSDKISIMIASIGFKSYLAELTFDSKQSSLELKPIILNSDPMMLKEVEIKGDVPAVKIKRDTIEYNIDSYVIREGDYLEDLMKQLPGIE
ncbi:MAG: carboxypeptidase-like regulatory domain-containing protein, partial [Pedobacter sp.]